MPATFETGAPITRAPGQAIIKESYGKMQVTRPNVNDDGQHHNGRRVEVGEGIEETFGLGFGFLRLFDQFDDFRESRVIADLFRDHFDEAVVHQCSRKDFVIQGFIGRNRFSRHSGFVDGRLTLHDDAVDRDFAARFDEQPIPDCDIPRPARSPDHCRGER